MRKNIYLLVLLGIAYFLTIFYGFSFLYQQILQPPVLTEGSTVVIDGVNWTQVLCWNFSEGLYPGDWGWGNWEIVDGMLELRDPNGTISVYFFPFDHGENFILETKVKFIQGADIRDVEAQLLTRDSNKINFESGMVLFAKENRATVRHMANRIDYVYETFNINVNIAYGEWHVMRFVVYNGTIKAFVNEVQIYASNNSFPVGEYHEPHLAVKYGIARFEYVKIFVVT